MAEWQTRTFEGRVSNRTGSSPVERTNYLQGICRRDGIGRRAGLKIPWWQHRMGSTPIAGTNIKIWLLEEKMKDIMNNPAVVQQLVIFAILLFAMWFLIMRPQKKKEKEINNMRNSLKQGDEIITIGGIYGKVMKVKDESIIIQVGVDKVKFEITKWAVSKVVNAAPDNSKKEVEETKKKSLPKKLLKKDEVEAEEAVEVSEEVAEEAKNED